MTVLTERGIDVLDRHKVPEHSHQVALKTEIMRLFAIKKDECVTVGAAPDFLGKFISTAAKLKKRKLYEIYYWHGESEMLPTSDTCFPYVINGRTYIFEQLPIVSENGTGNTRVYPQERAPDSLAHHIKEWTAIGSMFWFN